MLGQKFLELIGVEIRQHFIAGDKCRHVSLIGELPSSPRKPVDLRRRRSRRICNRVPPDIPWHQCTTNTIRGYRALIPSSSGNKRVVFNVRSVHLPRISLGKWPLSNRSEPIVESNDLSPVDLPNTRFGLGSPVKMHLPGSPFPEWNYPNRDLQIALDLLFHFA